jgi:dTDP-4-amino-4,6-dideoxygalactose transaminase
LLVNDARFTERAEIIREKGTNRSQFFRGEVDKYTWVDIGSSYLPSELVSAFLYAQLERASDITARRCHICTSYTTQLAPLRQTGQLRIAQFDDDSNGHMYYVITDDLKTRTALISHLKTNDIHPVFHYVPLHSSPAGRKYGRVNGKMQVTNDLSERLLRLPLYFEMTDEEIKRVTQAVFAFYNQKF